MWVESEEGNRKDEVWELVRERLLWNKIGICFHLLEKVETEVKGNSQKMKRVILSKTLNFREYGVCTDHFL